MILVDSSVWINFFNGIETPETNNLDKTLGNEEIIIGDLILTEVLQGFRLNKDYKTALKIFGCFNVCNLCNTDIAIKSASNLRKLRNRGIAIQNTSDVIISTYCIENKIPLLFSDKDFQPFVEYLHLRSAL